MDRDMAGLKDYRQFEYVSGELRHIFAAADIVISRAGANAIFELLALKKPNLLYPLSKKSSRGDQILNAESFRKSGYSMVLEEEALSESSLIAKIDELYSERGRFIDKMNSSPMKNGIEEIIKMIGIYSK